MRMVGSSEVDPYSAVAAGISALYGPLHGGANEAVLRMLREIGHVSKVPDFIKEVKSGEGETKLMGFGHRVYKSYDPRAKVIKRVADEVFEVTGKNPLLDIALELERIALQDEYFVKRKLYPNVDFYSGLIYEAMGFPVEMFPVLFAIPRTVGWVRAVGGDGHGPGAEDCPPAPGVHRLQAPRLRPHGEARREVSPGARGRGLKHVEGRGTSVPAPFAFPGSAPERASAAWPPSAYSASIARGVLLSHRCAPDLERGRQLPALDGEVLREDGRCA